MRLLKRVRALCHVDDRERAEAYLTWLRDDAPATTSADPVLQAYARMLFFSSGRMGAGSIRTRPDSTRFAHEPACARTCERWSGWACKGPSASPLDCPASWACGRCESTPGTPGRRSSRRWTTCPSTDASPTASVKGVLFSAAANADALLVTLHKSEADYSPTTMYQDYAISPELFHWESQSVTTVASKTGQRYLNHRASGSHVLLFTRPQKDVRVRHGRALPVPRGGRLRRAPGRAADRDHLAPSDSDAGRRLRRG